MAIELELPELTPGEEAPPPQSRPSALSVKQTILATLVVTVMAVAMGALFAVPPPVPEPVVKVDAGAPGAPAAARTDLFEMPPIVTNLGSPKDTWIRLEASIVFDAKAVAHPETLADEIASDELAYLRTVTLSEIEGPIGLQNIRQDLNERASIRSDGKVSELIIRTLVVQ
jgi:flagellar FliL protein